MEYKKALNRARSVKRRPPTKKGRESLKSRDSSQDIEDFYKNSSLVQHLEKEKYTPTPREKTSPDNFNNSGDETFVTANNTLPSTLSTSFDQMEYQEPNSQSDFNPAQASTPKKRGVFSRLFGKGKKDDNTSAEEPKLTKSQEQLQRTKSARQGVADKNKATADEVKRKSAEYQAQIEQDNNERIEKVKVDREAQRKAKEVRRRQAAEAYVEAKKKNNIEEARIQKNY